MKKFNWAMFLILLSIGCTQETQNQFGRNIQNWTGSNGVLDMNQNHIADP